MTSLGTALLYHLGLVVAWLASTLTSGYRWGYEAKLAGSTAGWQCAQGYLVGRVCIAVHIWSVTCPILTTALLYVAWIVSSVVSVFAMNTDSYNMLKTVVTLIFLYIVLVVSLQWSSYHDICWPNVLSPFTWTVIHPQCYCSMLHWYLHTYLHCSNEMWMMSFELLVHIAFHNDTFYLHRGIVILSSSSILQHSEHIPYSVTLVVWVVFRGYNSSSTSRDFL